MNSDKIRNTIRTLLFELFDSKDTYPFFIGHSNFSQGTPYYFETENGWDYAVYFKKTDIEDEDFWFVGFKAKKKNEPNMNFDFDVLTNDNTLKVLNTIIKIIKKHQQEFSVQKYCFSTSSQDKSLANKRASLYKKIVEKMPGWKITRDEEHNKYFLEKV